MAKAAAKTLHASMTEFIDAFMNVPEFTHGVRSMEFVVRMSRWINGCFLKASLPAKDQLTVHAPDFLAQDMNR